MADSPDDDLDDWSDEDECANCGGTGFVYMCVSEYACVDPEDGCDLCEKNCDWCDGKGK